MTARKVLTLALASLLAEGQRRRCRFRPHKPWFAVGEHADHVVRGCWRCDQIRVFVASPFTTTMITDLEAIRHLFDHQGRPR